MNPEKSKSMSEKGFIKGEILPGGYYQPPRIEVKIGKHVQELLEHQPNPEMMPYIESFLKDAVDDFRLIGKEISEMLREPRKS